jgi:hypothetical protein
MACWQFCITQQRSAGSGPTPGSTLAADGWVVMIMR